MATTSIIIFRAGLELTLTHLLGLLECSAFLGKGLSVRFAAHFIQCCLERIGGTRRRIWFGHPFLFTSSQQQQRSRGSKKDFFHLTASLVVVCRTRRKRPVPHFLAPASPPPPAIESGSNPSSESHRPKLKPLA